MNKGSYLEKWHKTVAIIYLVFLLTGILALLLATDPFTEGLGWGLVFCPLIGYGFYYSQKDVYTDKIETYSVYLLLIQLLSGVGLIIYSSKFVINPFVCGIGTTLAIFGSLAFAFELIRRFACNI